MKNFLSKYWKRILITIASIFVVINVYNKCVAPRLIISDYAKYGKDVTASNIVGSVGGAINSGVGTLTSSAPSDILRLAIILAIGLLVAVIIREITTKKAPAKKK